MQRRPTVGLPSHGRAPSQVRQIPSGTPLLEFSGTPPWEPTSRIRGGAVRGTPREARGMGWGGALRGEAGRSGCCCAGRGCLIAERDAAASQSYVVMMFEEHERPLR